MNSKILFRSIEALSLSVFAVFEIRLGWVVTKSLFGLPFTTAWAAALFAVSLAGYVISDFFSGLVHFLADNFGSPNTPFWGPKFIRPFREHHTDPKAITRHSFLEVNGDNALVSLVVLLPVFFLFPPAASKINTLIGLGTFVFLFAIVFTNQIHSWAHAESTPRFVRWLQRHRLILAPDHHSIHHTSPFDTYYCITTGWLNKLVERTGVLPKFVAWVKRRARK